AVIGGGIPASRLDLVDDFLRRRLVRPLASPTGSRIVHHDLGTVRRHQLGDFGADPAAGSRANCDPSLEHAHPSDSLDSTCHAVVAAATNFVNRGTSDPGPVRTLTKIYKTGNT